MFSNIGEHVRRLPSPASEAALPAGSRKSVRVVFSGGRHLELRSIGRIDVPRWERAHVAGKDRFGGLDSCHRERCQRVRFDRAVASRKSSDALPPPHASCMKATSIDPKPAARRQARGRWRLDDRKVVRRRPRFGGNAMTPVAIREVESWRVFPRLSADRLRR
jgi:hypothetical protein